MKLYNLIFILFLLASCSSGPTDTEQIQSMYDKYTAAMTDKNVDGMTNLIDDNAITYYDEVVRKAHFADSVELNSSYPLDKMLILYLRQTMPIEALKIYTGKELMTFTLFKGVNTKHGVPKIELLEITIQDKKAEATYLIDGENNGNLILFSKANDTWKLDLSTMYNSQANQKFSQTINKMGLTENEYIQQMISTMSGEKMENSIWHKTIR